MAELKDREHFIPMRRCDLVDLLARFRDLPQRDADLFRRFCQVLIATFHHEYHKQLESLKNAYAPFDPDSDTREVQVPPQSVREVQLDRLFLDFAALMERANFKHLRRDDYLEATSGATIWGLNMDVDFDVFERLEVFARGESVIKRSYRPWSKGFKKVEMEIPTYRRLALILKLRPHKRLGPNPFTNHVLLKIFKDIPKLDMEMLLPGARLKMPGFQKGKLGASVASSVGLLAYKFATEMGHVAWEGVVNRNPLALWGPMSIAATYGYRQYSGFSQTRKGYHLQLTQSLYYQSLDSNAGVLCRLLDEAEEQECREAILGYFFLWRLAGAKGWNAEKLDAQVEQYLEKDANIKVDFEIGDALGKLERLRLVERTENAYVAVPIETALERLDDAWDNIFQYGADARARNA
ncbi:hypothetical protein BH10PLA2_BH10PLA2_19270 [soil metagenome]